MEEQVEIEVQEQEPVQQDPPKKKLWKSLNADKLYTKSYEEFEKQFSNPESITKLHQSLSNDHLYTKGEAEFNKQFFSDIKPSKKKSWFSCFWRKLLISRIGFRNPFYIRDTNSK